VEEDILLKKFPDFVVGMERSFVFQIVLRELEMNAFLSADPLMKLYLSQDLN
jgi:hypothetical protein